MAFLEQRLDPRITQGATGGPSVPGRSKTYTPSGKLRQNFLAALPIHRYEVNHGALDRAAYQALLDLWYVVMFTPYQGFRFRDLRDYRATKSNSRCTLISGSAFQLQRVHRFGGIEFVRPIYKPAGTVVVYRTRASVESTATASVDTTTGVATITGHAAGDTYTWAGEFDIPVTFSDDDWVGELQATIENPLVICPPIKLEEIRL